jgi:bifunctional glutamyl/prolyl-tRNA synthetase
VPCGITVNLKDEERSGLYAACEEYEKEFVAAGIRVKGDYRENYSPGWKFNHWELKGVPIRVEVGPRDVKSGQFVAVRRDTGEKVTLNKADSVKDIKKLLDDVQASLFARYVVGVKPYTIEL